METQNSTYTFIVNFKLTELVMLFIRATAICHKNLIINQSLQ